MTAGRVREALPLLHTGELDSLRTALAEYTVEGVQHMVGLAGHAALSRGDLSGVTRLVRPADRLGTLIRLFMLAEPVT